MAADPLLLHVVPSQANINGLFDSLTPLPGGGGGAFSVVFEARHIASGARVALKFLSTGATADAYRAACFKREGDLLKALRGEEEVVALVEDPQTLALPVVHAGTGSTFTFQCPFVGMEWMGRGSLGSECTPAAGPTEFTRRMRLFRQAHKCVARLHKRHQLVHRDLKPSNFLVNDRMVVKLADLGTGRLLAPGHAPLLSTYSGPAGDFWYTAPEMVAGLHYDDQLLHGADLYSLGAMLFEFLTGMRLAAFTFGSLLDIRQFSNYFHTIPEKSRKSTFDAFLDGERSSRIPDPSGVNPLLPAGTRERVMTLVQSLAAFDYRRRLSDPLRVYQIVDTCIAIVEHERTYQDMLVRRRMRRQRRAHA